MIHVHYLITVIPADGYGVQWHELFSNYCNAETRVRELAQNYGLNLTMFHDMISAIRFDNFDRYHYIAEINIEKLLLED